MAAGDSSARRPTSNVSARASVVLGVLALAVPPVAIAAANRLERVTLVQGVAVATGAAVLGVAAIVLARRGRRTAELTLGRVGGERAAQAGRVLGYLGVWLGVTAALTLGFFAVLRYLS